MNRIILIAAAVIAVAGGAAYFLTSSSNNSTQVIASAEAQSSSETVDTSSINEMFLGSEDAPVTVVEYASYTCPHCASFHANTFKQIKANYIDTGKVKFVYREVYFDRYGLWGSMVARCGNNQQRFFGISDLIYKDQRSWTASGDPTTIAGELRKIGLTAGLAPDEVDACMQDADVAQTLVGWYQENADRDNVRETPSFLIDGENYSNMSYADFSAVLDEKIGNN